MLIPNKKAVGIFGGSFDPPHKGHVQISKISLKKIKLKKIYWIITKKNPFKRKPFFSLGSLIKLEFNSLDTRSTSPTTIAPTSWFSVFIKSAIKSSILPFLIRAKALPSKNGSASTISVLNFLTYLKILEF